MYCLHLFGAFELLSGHPAVQMPVTQKCRALLTLLAVHPLPISRELAAATLWPDVPDARARRNLNNVLWRLKRLLGSQALLAESDTLQLDARQWWIDVRAFESLLAQSPAEALQLYRGDLAPELYDDFVVRERERLRGLFLDTLAQLRRRYEDQHDLKAALDCAQRLAAADPMREDAHRDVMRLLAALGRPTEALAQFELCRETLARELGVEPAPETLALQREIASARATRTATDLAELERLPLVGRQAELGRLLTTLESAFAGRGSIALIEGEAGLGKSRLLIETAEAARWRDLPALVGRAREGDAARPYGPLVEAVRGGLTAPRLHRLKQLPFLVRAFAARVLPELGPPEPQTDPGDESKLDDALARVIAALASESRLVLLLDDLQWADVATLRLLPRLADESAVIVAAARPAEMRARADLWPLWRNLDRHGAERFVLRPLTLPETQTLVENALRLTGGGAAERAAPGRIGVSIERLHADTDGNPFLILEWLRVWRESSARPDAEPSASNLSDGARWHNLTAAETEALEWLAVVGREVEPELVERLAPCPAETFAHLEALTRRRLLVEGSAGYAFTHDILRQAVYSRIPLERRRQLHARAAQALAQLSPHALDEHARHWAAAGHYAEAARAWLAAGAGARAISANSSADMHFTQALESARQAGDAALIFEAASARGDLRRYLGRAPEAVEDLRLMRQAAEDMTDDRRLAEADIALSHALHLAGQNEASEAAAVSALQRAGAINDLALRAQALHCRARNAWERDRYADSIALLDEAIGLLRSAGQPLRLALALTDLALFCMFQYAAGEMVAEKGMAALQEAVALFRQENKMAPLAVALNNLGHWHTLLGGYAEALQAYSDAGRLYEMHGYFAGRLPALVAWGHVCGELGDLEGARRRLTEAVEVAQAYGDPLMFALANAHRARLAARSGDWNAALEHIRSALDAAQQSKATFIELFVCEAHGELLRGLGAAAEARQIHAECLRQARERAHRTREATALAQCGFDLLALGDAHAALERFREAEGIARQLNSRPLLTEALIGLSDASRASGDHKSAEAAAAAALQAAREMGAVYRLVEAQIALGQALAESGRDSEARTVLAQASLHAWAFPELMAVAEGLLGRCALAQSEWATARDYFLRAESAAAPLFNSLPPPPLGESFNQYLSARVGLPPGFQWLMLPELTLSGARRALWPKRVETGASASARREALARLETIANAQNVRPTVAALASALGLTPRTIRRLRANP